MDIPSVSPRCAASYWKESLRPRHGSTCPWSGPKMGSSGLKYRWLSNTAQLSSLWSSRKCRRSIRPLSVPRSATSNLQEMATLDKLIDLMLSARSPEEVIALIKSSDEPRVSALCKVLCNAGAGLQLGKITGENLLAFDQKFWLRLATRSDTAASAEEKKRLQDLAGVTMRMVDAMVKRSDHQLNDSASVLQKILVAAADENGQWQLPLPDENVEAMRKEMEANAAALDESLLANAFAWMRKAKADNLEGTVALLQQALQLYSAWALVSRTPQAAEEDAVLEEVLALKEAEWGGALEAAQASGRVSGPAFLLAVRRKMETVVLALPSGSYAQRVQAEYLKELETRAEKFFGT